jgi:hypothetical protein
MSLHYLQVPIHPANHRYPFFQVLIPRRLEGLISA